MATRLVLSHEARVDLYVNIIKAKLPGPLTEYNVALMRNAAPSVPEMEALNEALVKMGWEK